MCCFFRRGSVAAALVLAFSQLSHAVTIIKADLHSTGPDAQFVNGVFGTVVDGNVGVTSPGDQDSSITFHEFVEGEPGVNDIVLPAVGSFSLSDVSAVGPPVPGLANTIQQQTTGGTFEVYDDLGRVLLTGTLKDGVLSGTAAGGAAAGGFVTANLGTFTGPSDASLDHLFSLLDPNSASISIPLSDIGNGGTSGLLVAGGVLQDFTADAQVNIGAEALSTQLPEPTSSTLALFAAVGLLGLRKRRC